MGRASGNKFSHDTRLQIKDAYQDTCQECGIRKGTQVHHIVQRSDGGMGIFTNGILFCGKCHKKVHASPELLIKWQSWALFTFGDNYWKPNNNYLILQDYRRTICYDRAHPMIPSVSNCGPSERYWTRSQYSQWF